MVEKFIEILRAIEARRGPVTLFALLRMDEFLDKWTVVISAPWASQQNRAEVFEELRNSISTKLSEPEKSEIARIGIFPREEHLIEDLLRFKAGQTLRDVRVNGNQMHLAHIIASNQLADTGTMPVGSE